MAGVEERVRAFVLKEIMFAEKESVLSSDQPLLEEGIIDSMDLQRLVAFLETEFGITVTDDALVPANFQDIDAIVRMVEERQAGEG